MVRFASHTSKRRSVRNYASRREQLRLLALFVPLALVILLMVRLRDPKTATAINAFFAPAAAQSTIKSRPTVADSAPSRPPQPFPGIRAELVKTIQDNTYFRTDEKNAWFHFLELLQKEKTTAALGVEVEYTQLVDQPNVYRGTLVTVRGTARQITQEIPAENNLGISSYYRVVIQPADGANWPIIVYALQLPPGVSAGDELSLDVTVTGLFFKKLSYKWRDGLGIAPVIVARAILAGVTSVAPVTSRGQEGPDVSIAADGETRQAQVDKPVAIGIGTLTESQLAIQKMLALDGWDMERLASFDVGAALSDNQRADVLKLLRRMRTIDFDSLVDWYNSTPANFELKDADAVRGVFHRLIGRVTRVKWHKLTAEDAQLLEMSGYFECEFSADNLTGPITILTARVPRSWPRNTPMDEPAWTRALIVKRQDNESPPRTVWLATDIAWHPGIREFEQARSLEDMFRTSPDPLFGKSMLGALYVDVGQFDLVESRGRIRPQERQLFYHILSAVGHIKAATLVRLAKDNLPVVMQEWRDHVQAGDDARRAPLAREVVRRADEGRYSVAMLFNDPEPQIGRLFVFDCVAKRAVRVEMAHKPLDDGSVSYPYGFDHYYELEVFTDDSQNYPLIFCVRELPKDFPIGADIRVPVRVAGFFFKNWLYNARGRGPSGASTDDVPAGPRAQFAPLLIGRAPIVLAEEQGGGRARSFVLGGLFLLAFLGILAAAVWFARDDRRYRERTPAANFDLPAGVSLNDLNLQAANVPMTTEIALPPPGNPSD